MNVVQSMINGADRNILITGYSLSSYFSELVDTIIQKSQRGVFVKFFVNDIDKQPSFDKILRYKGRFLKIYNYRQDDDKMAALHAKVISVDQQQTLITSANLSYEKKCIYNLLERCDIMKEMIDNEMQMRREKREREFKKDVPVAEKLRDERSEEREYYPRYTPTEKPKRKRDDFER